MNNNLNKVVLRPRFKIELNKTNNAILETFEEKQKSQDRFIVSRIDDHVFIKFPKEQQHFWSPQLHLEINETGVNKSELYGLFGPNPTVWTLFMFFHFIVAFLFIAFSIWAYSNYTLKKDYYLQFLGIGLMVVIWFVLYLSGRISKASNQKEMRDLYHFMNEIIEE